MTKKKVPLGASFYTVILEVAGEVFASKTDTTIEFDFNGKTYTVSKRAKQQ